MAYAILDVEGIQISKEHMCTRKLYILHENGKDQRCIEFKACVDYEQLRLEYQEAFRWCERRIHKLPYHPRKGRPCEDAKKELKEFVNEHQINVIYYKGGTIEKNLCKQIDFPCFNIEDINAPKVNSHDPRVEVRAHWEFVKKNEDEIRQTVVRALYY